MTNITKIVWRLKEQPTSDKISLLVDRGILTKDEAREILFSSETQENRDMESLKSEIKFLRELVEKLADNKKVVEVIREVEPCWNGYRWWSPYWSWTNLPMGATDATGEYTLSGSYTLPGSSNFSDINTF